jgi:hypothetical protein
MHKEIYEFMINDYERRVIIHALNTLRSKQLEEKQDTETVNELLLKCIDKKPKSKNGYEER